MNPETDDQYAYLRAAARAAGAVEAVIIPAAEIVVQERVSLKCRTGCSSYGRSLACPPHVPQIDEFRRMLEGYQDALFLRFRSGVQVDTEILHQLVKNRNDPAVPKDTKKKTEAFSEAFNAENRKIHDIMLDLERQAFEADNPFALALTVDSCDLCRNCNIDGGFCRHPERLRYSLESVGINVVETAKRAGMRIRFPAPNPPDRITLLLIT